MPSKHAHRPTAIVPPKPVAPSPLLVKEHDKIPDAKKEGADATLSTLSDESNPPRCECNECVNIRLISHAHNEPTPDTNPSLLGEDPGLSATSEEEEEEVVFAKPALAPEIVTGIIKQSYAVRTISRILVNGREAQASHTHAFPKHDYIMTQMLGAYNRREQDGFLALLVEYLRFIPRFVPHCGTEQANTALIAEVVLLMNTYGFVPVAAKLLGSLYSTTA